MMTYPISDAITRDSIPLQAMHRADSSPQPPLTLPKAAVTPPDVADWYGAPPAQARDLLDREWNVRTKVQFVPDNFLVLPKQLQLSPAGSADWVDPLGAETARANATLLPLAPARLPTERTGSGVNVTPSAGTGPSAGTLWSKALPHGSVLQLQPPLHASTTASPLFQAALMTSGVTDLFVVDALVPPPDASKAPLAFNQKNPAVPAVLKRQAEWPLRSDGPLATFDVSTIRPVQGQKFPMPRMQMNFQLSDTAGGKLTHQCRVHCLNLDDPQWCRQMLRGLMVDSMDPSKRPLMPAVMCEDGANKSGVVATALHAMQCLEAMNLGTLRMSSPEDLARQMSAFVAAGQAQRSPSFAALLHNFDMPRLANDIWEAWTDNLSSPETLAVRVRQGLQGGAVPAVSEAPTGDASATDLVDSAAAPGAAVPSRTVAQRPAPLTWARVGSPVSIISDDSGCLSADAQQSSRDSVFDFQPLQPLQPVAELSEEERARSQPASQRGAVPGAEGVQTPALPTAVASSLSRFMDGSATTGHFKEISLPRHDGGRARTLTPSNRISDKAYATLSRIGTARPDRPAKAQQPTVSPDVPQELNYERTAFRDDGTPRMNVGEQTLLMHHTRERAEQATSADLAALHPDVRRAWLPGGDSFERFKLQLDGFVKEMTASTGLSGYLRAKLSDPVTRALAPHIAWATTLAEEIQIDLARAMEPTHSANNAVPDPSQAALLTRETIKQLLEQRFNALTPSQQSRWRERVSGKSDRFNQALQESRRQVEDLPLRVMPRAEFEKLEGGRSRTGVVPLFFTKAPPVNPKERAEALAAAAARGAKGATSGAAASRALAEAGAAGSRNLEADELPSGSRDSVRSHDSIRSGDSISTNTSMTSVQSFASGISDMETVESLPEPAEPRRPRQLDFSDIRSRVDQAWAPHWVLSLTAQVSRRTA
jgi:hypothetical protein